MTGTSIVVILRFFAVLFLTAIPFLRWTPGRLFLAAVLTAVLAPALIQVILQLALLPGGSAVGFLLTGVYRITTWLPLVMAGMAIGRLDLTDQRIAAWVAGIGAAFMVAASVLALTLPGVLSPVARTLGADPDSLPSPQIGIIELGTPMDQKSAPDPTQDLPSSPQTPEGSAVTGEASTSTDGALAPVPAESIDFTGMTCQPSAPGDTTVVCWSGEAMTRSADAMASGT